MKKLLMSYVLLVSFSAVSNDLLCKGKPVESSLHSNMNVESCIGLQNDLAVINGIDSSRNLVLNFVDLSEKKILASLDLKQIELNGGSYVETAAFRRACGTSLTTSRIHDRNEVVIFFDNTTALHWDILTNKTELLHSFYTGGFYFCYGIGEGIDTFREYISIDRRNRQIKMSAILELDESFPDVYIKY